MLTPSAGPAALAVDVSPTVATLGTGGAFTAVFTGLVVRERLKSNYRQRAEERPSAGARIRDGMTRAGSTLLVTGQPAVIGLLATQTHEMSAAEAAWSTGLGYPLAATGAFVADRAGLHPGHGTAGRGTNRRPGQGREHLPARRRLAGGVARRTRCGTVRQPAARQVGR